MKKNFPIFIVGNPRSGTTLLATLLSSHSKISCGPETHFFAYLNKWRSSGKFNLIYSDWPKKATDLITSIELENQKIYDLFDIDRTLISSFLSNRDPSIQAMIESLTLQHSLRQEKTKWAEKTPRHLLFANEIRQLYPEARIVRITRDPRDSVFSLCKVPWASQNPLENAYTLLNWHLQSASFFKEDQLTYTIRYEDLLCSPQEELASLCCFLEEEYESKMLDTTEAAVFTAPQNEPWKEQVSQKLDPSRSYAWKQRANDLTIDAISQICKPIISNFKYEPCDEKLRNVGGKHISYNFAWKCGPELLNLVNTKNFVLISWTNMKAGDPFLYCDLPVGRNFWEQIKLTASLIIEILYLRFRGKSVRYSDYCTYSSSIDKWHGRLALSFLRYFGRCYFIHEL